MSTWTPNWDAANTRACLLCLVIFDNFSSQDLPISSSSQERVKHFHGNGSSDYSEDDFKVMAIELNTIAGLMAGIRAFCAASNMEAFWLEKFRLVEKTLKHFAVFKFICLKWNEFTPSMLPYFRQKWNGWLNKTSASIFISCFLQNSRCLPFQQSQCLQCLPISRLCRISPRAHCRPTSLLLGDPICQQISFGRTAYNIMKMKGFWLCQMFGLTVLLVVINICNSCSIHVIMVET